MKNISIWQFIGLKIPGFGSHGQQLSEASDVPRPQLAQPVEWQASRRQGVGEHVARQAGAAGAAQRSAEQQRR